MKRWYGPRSALLAGLMAFVAAPAAAQTAAYPAKPLRLVVPYPTGTSTDLLARIIVDKLGAQLGQHIVVENKGGASGSVGAKLVAMATADGYTLMLGTSGIIAGNPALMPKLNYDPGKDFAAVGGIAQNPMVLAVGSSTGIKSVAELVDLLKKQPAKSNFGSTGVGGVPAMAAAALLHASGLKASHIPYNGVSQALTALSSGDVTFMFYGSLGLLPMVKGGQLRVLATGGTRKSVLYPELNTMQELGYKDFSAASWFALYAPAGTPAKVISVLAGALNVALKTPDISGKLVQWGFDPWFTTPQALTAFGVTERQRYRDQVRKFGGIEN